jgi:DNA-binding transcriptional LysR family regulator
MPDPDLNLLIALDVLLVEGSVAGAARRLGLSASAMSRTLARLRAITGDPLLVRAGRRMVLTPHAERLRQRTGNTVQDARSILRPSRAEENLATLRRTFVVRANDGFVETFGAALISMAGVKAPMVRLRFVSKPEKSSAALRAGDADLEIGVLTNTMGPEVRIQALYRDRFVGVVRKGHPLEREHDINAQCYVRYGHVVASRRANPHGPVDDALAELGVRRTVCAVVPGFSAALAVARSSDLVALVPASFLWRASGQHAPQVSDTCFAFELPVKTPGITISQMWHPRLGGDPVHRWLRQRVLAVCREKAAYQGTVLPR